MVKANVDKILEYMADKKSVSVSELAKKLSLKKDDVMKSAEYLEQDGVIKLDRKFSKTVLTLVKKPEGEKKLDLPQPPMPQQQPQPETLSKPSVQEQNNEIPKWPGASPPKDQKPEWPGQSQEPIEPVQEKELPKPPVQQVKEEPKPELKEEKLKQELKPKLEETKQKVKPAEVPNVQEQPVELKEQVEQPIPESKQTPPEPVQEIEQPEASKIDMKLPLSNEEKEPFVMPENKEAEPVPEPLVEKKESKPEKPVLSGTQEFSTDTEIKYPETSKTDVEKIDFLLDEIDKRILNHKYDNMNQVYRQLYNLYQNGKLSSNEKYLFSEKINDIFERIKNLHMIEETL